MDLKQSKIPEKAIGRKKDNRKGQSVYKAKTDRKTRTPDCNPDEGNKSYQRFEYRTEGNASRSEKADISAEYILTGRNPIREALKNHHDL